MRKSQVASNKQQQAAAAAQRARADVRLAYTEIHAPIDGIVDVRAALPGEVVTAGQPVVTLINQDDLWVRVDIEETYIDSVRVGDKLTVRLPVGRRAPRHGLLSRRRRRLRHAAGREPDEAGHQDVRSAAAPGQQGAASGRRHDRVRVVAASW